MNKFETVIKNYLDKFAQEDSHFADKYADEKKSIEKCCDYIISEVKKTKRVGFADEEVFQLARHYFLEDVGEIRKHKARVVVNEEDGDIEDEDYEQEKPIKVRKQKVASSLEEKKVEPRKNEQISLFDFTV